MQLERTETIYGIRAVLEAIEANQSINKIFVQKGLKGELFSTKKWFEPILCTCRKVEPPYP